MYGYHLGTFGKTLQNLQAYLIRSDRGLVWNDAYRRVRKLMNLHRRGLAG